MNLILYYHYVSGINGSCDLCYINRSINLLYRNIVVY